MAVTENTHISWLSRIGNSFKGILLGLMLIVLAAALLFWNEGRAVHRRTALNKAADVVVNVTSDAVDPANDGKLIHLSGPADTAETLTDPLFDVSVRALKLNRKVEMYQWQEYAERKEKRNTGGSVDTTTTYSYQKGWSEQPISSADFNESGHENPSMPYTSEKWTAEKITVGAFTLSDSLKSKIGGFEPYRPGEKSADSPAAPNAEQSSETAPNTSADISIDAPTEKETKETAAVPAPSDLSISVTTPATDQATTETAAPTDKQISGKTPSSLKKSTTSDGFYFGDSPENPAIGDVRVSYSVVMPCDLSLIACQTKDTFTPYIIKNNPVEELGMGIQTAEQMFASAQSANNMALWLLRAVGIFLCFLGFRLLFGPLPVLADVLPIAGSIVSAGTGIISFLLTLIISLTTISIAWIFYRPILGVPTLLAAVLLLIYLFKRLHKKGPAPAQDGTSMNS